MGSEENKQIEVGETFSGVKSIREEVLRKGLTGSIQFESGVKSVAKHEGRQGPFVCLYYSTLQKGLVENSVPEVRTTKE